MSFESMATSRVSTVGPIDPCGDFKAMLARRDVDLVDAAIEQLKKRCVQLVNDSIQNQLYPKAIECLVALRQGCVAEEEPHAYNQFVDELRATCQHKRRHDFWLAMVNKANDLAPISSEETKESTLSQAQAEAYFASTQDTQSSPTPMSILDTQPSTVVNADDDDADADDLLDLI